MLNYDIMLITYLQKYNRLVCRNERLKYYKYNQTYIQHNKNDYIALYFIDLGAND